MSSRAPAPTLERSGNAAALTLRFLLAGVLIAGVAQKAHAACSAAPLAGCRTAARSTLDVRGGDASLRRLRWSWSRGRPALPAAFGNPTGTTDESVCLYDDGGLVVEANIAPHAQCGERPCWSVKGSTGFSYKDNAGTAGGIGLLSLQGSAAPSAKIKLKTGGVNMQDPGLPLTGMVTIQLTNSTSGVCFESAFDPDDASYSAKDRFKARSSVDDSLPVAALPSAGCQTPVEAYGTGANDDSLIHDGLTRTFGVYLPVTYDMSGNTPAPVVLIFHGGFGSGAEVFEHSRMGDLAEDEGVVVVSPDGVAGPYGVRTWNAGDCCGYAHNQKIDDSGFVAALLDRLEQSICLDRNRVFAMGMSNGAMLTYRLACDLSQRLAAVGPVAGADQTIGCTPTRPVSIMHVHGTDDMNVPWDGGDGCGPADVAFTSVSESVGGWVARDVCTGSASVVLEQGDGTCERQGECASVESVVLCSIAGGGHSWPGGEPLASSGLPDCEFGAQSTTFDATRNLFDFFMQHPLRR